MKIWGKASCLKMWFPSWHKYHLMLYDRQLRLIATCCSQIQVPKSTNLCSSLSLIPCTMLLLILVSQSCSTDSFHYPQRVWFALNRICWPYLFKTPDNKIVTANNRILWKRFISGIYIWVEGIPEVWRMCSCSYRCNQMVWQISSQGKELLKSRSHSVHCAKAFLASKNQTPHAILWGRRKDVATSCQVLGIRGMKVLVC